MTQKVLPSILKNTSRLNKNDRKIPGSKVHSLRLLPESEHVWELISVQTVIRQLFLRFFRGTG